MLGNENAETLNYQMEKVMEIPKIGSREQLAKSIREIGEREGEFIYQVIHFLVKEKMERGYSKKYSLEELLRKIPYKKSRLIERLQRATEEGVLKHKKRRYILNSSHTLVEKLWQYYHETDFQEYEKKREIIELIQKKEEGENEIRELEKDILKVIKYKELTEREEKKLRVGMYENIEENVNADEDLKEYIKNNIEIIIGYKI